MLLLEKETEDVFDDLLDLMRAVNIRGLWHISLKTEEGLIIVYHSCFYLKYRVES